MYRYIVEANIVNELCEPEQESWNVTSHAVVGQACSSEVEKWQPGAHVLFLTELWKAYYGSSLAPQAVTTGLLLTGMWPFVESVRWRCCLRTTQQAYSLTWNAITKMSIRLATVHHHNSRSSQSKQSTLHESVNALQPLSTSLLIIMIHFHITIQQYIASILCTISNTQFFHIATALVLAATHEVIYNLQNTILQLKVLRTHWHCTNHFPPSTQSHLVTNLTL